MSLSDQITRRFQSLYDEIDSQMIRSGSSTFSDFGMSHSDDAKMLEKFRAGEISLGDVEALLEAAKEVDEEMQKFIAKNNLRKKVEEKKKQPSVKKSGVPPIWDDQKLNEYIDSIVEEVLESCEVSDEIKLVDPPKPAVETKKPTQNVIKPILKQKSSQPLKRNVATNVKFRMHPEKLERVQSRQAKTNKRIQTAPSGLFKMHSTSETSLAARVCNKDGSVDVNFGKSSKTSVPQRPKTVPAQLKLSSMTVTSTKKPTQVQKRIDDECKGNNGSLATKVVKMPKQMTTQVLPVVSIKGSCAIQKIYQIDILPTDETVRDNFEARPNTKFYEFTHECPPKPQTEPVQAENSAVVVENANQTSFLDASDLKRALNECGVHFRDGKIHVVVEGGRTRRSNKKTRARKIFKPSTLRKSIDEFSQPRDDNDGEKFNICSSVEPAVEQKLGEEQINEKDSSMSSSITDDGKIRQILQINRRVDRHRTSSGRDSSSDSYPESSALGVTSLEPHEARRAAQTASETFQSIYKLIEDTFETTDVEKPAMVDKQGGDGLHEMQEVIKMSEENMKRAEMLLKKYQKSDVEEFVEEVAIEESNHKVVENTQKTAVEAKKFCNQEIQTDDDLLQTETRLVDTKEDPKPAKQSTDSFAQTEEDKNVQTDDVLSWKSPQFFGNVFEPYSNFRHMKFHQPPEVSRNDAICTFSSRCNCVGCQSTRNFNRIPNPNISSQLKTRLNQSPIFSPKKFPVPFNPMYEGDEEVMEAANKFLRSIEKQKRRNGDSTSSDSINSKFSPQKVHSRRSSSSISTPSSSLVQNIVQTQPEVAPVPRPRINLGDRLAAAAGNIVTIESKLGNFAGDSQSRHSSPDSPQFASPDSQDFVDRYLSEGEVLSQGEVQLGLSDEDDELVGF